jgi:hypothetical protein
MGGAISVRIAERPNVSKLFHGVLTMGAALLVKEDDVSLRLTHRPTIPILFLTNTSEQGPIASYIDGVKAQVEIDRRQREFGQDEVITPALHDVQREGDDVWQLLFIKTDYFIRSQLDEFSRKMASILHSSRVGVCWFIGFRVSF